MRSKHGLWLCQVCDRSYDTKTGLGDHVLAVHSIDIDTTIQTAPAALAKDTSGLDVNVKVRASTPEKGVQVESKHDSGLRMDECERKSNVQNNKSSVQVQTSVMSSETPAKAGRSKNMTEWSVLDVRNWLNEIKRPKAAVVFEEEGIDGDALIGLTIDDMINDLRVRPFADKTIARKIENIFAKTEAATSSDTSARKIPISPRKALIVGNYLY